MNRHLLSDNKNAYTNKKFEKDIKLSSDEFEEQPFCSFFALPDEVILKILKDLDLRSLYYMSKVNKRLNQLTKNPRLFTHLNLRYTDCFFIYNIIDFFDKCKSRCKYLEQLDLTSSNISVLHFEKLLNICGRRLTHLGLSSCRFVNDFVLLKISKICKNLKVLDLSNCQDLITAKGFSYLGNLECIKDLDLSSTRITVQPLCKILEKNRRMRNLNLSHVFIWTPLCAPEAVTIQLGNSCPDLEILDLTGTDITSRSIDALAECKNLRKLNVGLRFNNNRYPIDMHSVHRLLSSCHLLEEINSKHRTEWEYYC